MIRDELSTGVVPVERRAYVQELMDRRNKFADQCEGLAAKIAAIDEEIAAECEP